MNASMGQDILLGWEQTNWNLKRLVVVADVTQALTEDRPYRNGLPKPAVEKILYSEAREGQLDPELVSLAIDSLDEIILFNKNSLRLTNGRESCYSFSPDRTRASKACSISLRRFSASFRFLPHTKIKFHFRFCPRRTERNLAALCRYPLQHIFLWKMNGTGLPSV